MKNKIIMLVLSVILLTSCNEISSDYPKDRVVGSKNIFIINKAEYLGEENSKYKYAITDDTEFGWTLWSNIKYNIRDTLKLTK